MDNHAYVLVAHAAARFVRVVQSNEQPKESPIESFESNLLNDELEAWRDLCREVAAIPAANEVKPQ